MTICKIIVIWLKIVYDDASVLCMLRAMIETLGVFRISDNISMKLFKFIFTKTDAYPLTGEILWAKHTELV